MYERFYGFERPPFKLVADPSVLFSSRSAREALGRLEFCVKAGKGIVVMTGEVGTGKTTLVNRFLDKAGPDVRTAYIFNPTLTGLQLLRTLAVELGAQKIPRSKVDLTRVVYDVLLRNREAGRRTLVFVDEAQVLQREALEELRLVSNLETWSEKLLHIVLVGQPELLQTLESFELRPLRQRVELFIDIEPMSADETRQYVEHRLRAAKPRRDVAFSNGALSAVHDVSGGNPRDINKICDAALLMAYVEEATTVTEKHLAEAIETIDGRQVSLRAPAPRAGRAPARAWSAVATLAAVAALAFTYDSARIPPSHATGPDAVTHAAVPRAHDPDSARGAAPLTHAPLIHLASFADRQQAEEFARALDVAPGRTVYLQRAEAADGTWHRVLLGDFDGLPAAQAFAEDARRSGTYAYAQAVRVRTEALNEWAGP